MKNFDIALSRPIENGMSCYEVLQHKITSLEQAAIEKKNMYDLTVARMEQLKTRLDNWNVNRRERWNIEDEIAMLQTKANTLFGQYMSIQDECKGMRKSIDVIIYITNYGGEVTQQNRRRIESILNY